MSIKLLNEKNHKISETKNEQTYYEMIKIFVKWGKMSGSHSSHHKDGSHMNLNIFFFFFERYELKHNIYIIEFIWECILTWEMRMNCTCYNSYE